MLIFVCYCATSPSLVPVLCLLFCPRVERVRNVAEPCQEQDRKLTCQRFARIRIADISSFNDLGCDRNQEKQSWMEIIEWSSVSVLIFLGLVTLSRGERAFTRDKLPALKRLLSTCHLRCARVSKKVRWSNSFEKCLTVPLVWIRVKRSSLLKYCNRDFGLAYHWFYIL